MYYVHYLKECIEPPPIGTEVCVDWEANYLWVRKQLPWQQSNMFPIDDSHRSWIGDQVRLHRRTPEEALHALQEHRRMSDLHQEQIIEDHRPEHLPSRRRCMWLWDDRDGFDEDARAMCVVPAKQALVRIKPIDGKHTLHRARIDALSTRSDAPEAQFIADAREYWKGIPAPARGTEVLFFGSYEVVGHGR